METGLVEVEGRAMPVTVDATQASGHENRLRIKDFTGPELAALFVKQYTGLFTSRLNIYQRGGENHLTLRHSDIKYRLHYNTDVAADDLTRFRGYLKIAFACLSLETAVEFENFPINVYLTAANGSAGYVVRPTAVGRRRVGVFFGRDIWSMATLNLGTSIFANYLHAHEPGNAQAKFRARALAAIFHEFGHVIHQLTSPGLYFALGQLSIYGGKADSELDDIAAPVPKTTLKPWKRADVAAANQAAQQRHQQDLQSLQDLRNKRSMFADMPAPSVARAFREAYKPTVRNLMGAYAADREPEVVAEGYAAQMMGITLPAEVLTLYQQFGGITPVAASLLPGRAATTAADLMTAYANRVP